MTRRTSFVLALLTALSILSISALWAQTNVSFQMTASDGSGPTNTLTFVINTAGTIGVDSLSPSLVEKELPPAPQGPETRFLSNPGYDAFGPGSYTSIHKGVSDIETQIWRMQYKRDPSATAIDFTWPAGLANQPGSLGGFAAWRIIPDPLELDDTIPTVDMTTTTTLHHVVPDASPHTFYVVKGDGKLMRSFTPEEIALAVDSKGKSKAEKRKPYNSEGTFYFVNTTGVTLTDLHVEWKQAILFQNVSKLDNPPHDVDGKGKKFDYSFTSGNPDSVRPGDTVKIFARGDKGKTLTAAKYWWTLGGIQTPAKTKFGPLNPDNGGRLLLKMPNINNIGEEAYAQAAYDAADGLRAGIKEQAGVDAKLKPYFKTVIHPKWKDIQKTLNSKGTLHVSANGQTCLTTFLNSTKEILKQQKSLPPAKHNNHVLAGLVALKLNMAFSRLEKMPTQLDVMYYIAQDGDPPGFDNAPLSLIATQCDSFLSCQTTHLLAATGGQWDTILTRINSAFSGDFDTVKFGQGSNTKLVTTEATGVKPILGSCLYRTSLTEGISFEGAKGVDITTLERPVTYELMQNYPNPFNPTTTIEFNLQEDAVVTLKIYNMLGQEVATLAENEEFTEGNNELTFDASNFSSGVYYYRMIVNNGAFTQVKKMMLMK